MHNLSTEQLVDELQLIAKYMGYKDRITKDVAHGDLTQEGAIVSVLTLNGITDSALITESLGESLEDIIEVFDKANESKVADIVNAIVNALIALSYSANNMLLLIKRVDTAFNNDHSLTLHVTDPQAAWVLSGGLADIADEVRDLRGLLSRMVGRNYKEAYKVLNDRSVPPSSADDLYASAIDLDKALWAQCVIVISDIAHSLIDLTGGLEVDGELAADIKAKAQQGDSKGLVTHLEALLRVCIIPMGRGLSLLTGAVSSSLKALPPYEDSEE